MIATSLEVPAAEAISSDAEVTISDKFPESPRKAKATTSDQAHPNENPVKKRWLRYMMSAFTKLSGPQNNRGLTKTDQDYKYLLFDTFPNRGLYHFDLVADLIDFALVQTYREHETPDKGWARFQNKINSCQFVVGYAKPEENDTSNKGQFLAATGNPKTSGAVSRAEWQPTGDKKSGTFTYAIDRDGSDYNKPSFSTLSPTKFEFANYATVANNRNKFEKRKQPLRIHFAPRSMPRQRIRCYRVSARTFPIFPNQCKSSLVPPPFR